MIIRVLVRASVSALAVSAAGAAFAQSAATQEFDTQSIVVTGTKASKGVEGILVPNTSKAKQVLTQAFIANQRAGQSVDELINLMPGVNFQNNDPYGASGGTLNIRGFDASRISQTFDGIPLNDTGNYAIYSQQQLDSELIDQVNVNFGSTDVDSPTASATGSTVNYTTVNPTEDFHARALGSVGEYNYFRFFTKVDTGIFTPFGTRAWLAASHSENANPFNSNSRTDRYQFNGKLYQPIGSDGDFVSLAGHYNIGRNGNFSSVPLRTDLVQSPTNGAPRIVGSGSTNRFPIDRGERDYTPARCTTDTPQAGVADVPSGCGTSFDQSYNPSNTGNIRLQTRFTLAQGLVLTVEPSYQWVKANGGTGAVKANEGTYTNAAKGLTGLTGYIGGQPYFGGVDLNGDGDALDGATSTTSGTANGVTTYAPSQTNTRRWVVLSSLRYDLTPTQTVRLSYTFDHGRHRQQGPVSTIGLDGYANSYFPVDAPLKDAAGNIIQKRDRLSYAILNQVSGEYRGTFLSDRLTVNAGVRAPFFKRDLNNYCVTEAGGSFVDCFNGQATSRAAFLAANPTYAAPQSRTFTYNKVLPNGGLTYNVTNAISAFVNYSRGLQVPGTDNLYQSFAFARGTAGATPTPETTDNFDGGVRYKSGKIQAQVDGWYTAYRNRLASSYDPTLDITIYRNLGKVHRYGFDATFAYQPIRQATFYVFGSYLNSKILNDVQTGETAAGLPIFAATAGKRESGAAKYNFGGRAQGNIGPLEFGIQAKRTGPRYVNDQDLPITPAGYTTPVYGATAPAYTTVDLDARLGLGFAGLNDGTYFQLNVTNLFDKLYVAGFSGNTAATAIPFSYIGAPRAISGTVNIGF